jgi:two-component sensor histidine kinase
LCLTWCEAGGPAVSEPTQRGFGSTLIQESIPYELGGCVALDFAPGGVRCTISFPFASPSARD